MKDFADVMEARTGWRPGARLALTWRYVGPIALSVLFLVGVADSIIHPVTDVAWALTVGYLIALLPVVGFVVSALLPRAAHS